MFKKDSGKKDSGFNRALFCCMCGISTEQGQEIGRVFFRSAQKNELPSSTICGECINEAYNILDFSESADKVLKNREPNLIPLSPKLLKPREIYERLSTSVVGQADAKRALSTAVSWHIQKITDKNLSKSNVLLIGPTGTGKTELARAAAAFLDVPFVICDATAFTAHGYVGEDVESCLTRLLIAADNNLERAQNGIVFIDEIDKIADRDNSYIGTLAIQQCLLKILEGTVVNIPKSLKQKNGVQEYVQMDTSKILFICAGAFSGIAAKEKSRVFGLSGESSVPQKEETSQTALVNYGFIPEFLGRFKIVATTEQLTEIDLINILKLPKTSLLLQYKRVLKKYGVDLAFSDKFLESVAKEALSSGLGARGLSRILEKRLEKLLFKAPDYPDQKKKILL